MRALLLSLAALIAAAPAPAQQQPSPSPTPAGTEEQMPATAEDHLVRAGQYRAKAAEYRSEAAAHRKMASEYERAKGSPQYRAKTGRTEPWVAKMREHCESYIKAAEKMAKEAEMFADFHRMRAAELQGR